MGARSPESTRLAGVFLARHGETDYNAEHRFQGLLPVPLNANGRLQAEQLADHAASLGFAALGRPLAVVPNGALLDCSGAASSSGRAPDF